MDMLDKLEESPMLNRPLPNRAKGVNEDWDVGLVPEPAEASEDHREIAIPTFEDLFKIVMNGHGVYTNAVYVTLDEWMRKMEKTLNLFLASDQLATLTSVQIKFVGCTRRLAEVWADIDSLGKGLTRLDVTRQVSSFHQAWLKLEQSCRYVEFERQEHVRRNGV